jgi:hypothetical protein
VDADPALQCQNSFRIGPKQLWPQKASIQEKISQNSIEKKINASGQAPSSETIKLPYKALSTVFIVLYT